MLVRAGMMRAWCDRGQQKRQVQACRPGGLQLGWLSLLLPQCGASVVALHCCCWLAGVVRALRAGLVLPTKLMDATKLNDGTGVGLGCHGQEGDLCKAPSESGALPSRQPPTHRAPARAITI